MSTDPKRWLEEDGPVDEAQDLLRSAGDAEPPTGAPDAIWHSLAVKLAAPGGGGGGNAGSAGSGAAQQGGVGAGGVAGTSATKGVLALVVAGGVLASAAVAVLAIKTTRLEVTPQAASVSVATTPTPVASPAVTASQLEAIPVTDLPNAAAEAPSEDPSRQHIAPVGSARTLGPSPTAASPSAPASSAAPDGVDALLDERARLATARDAHRRGDDRAALAILDAARERYPNGVLVQEREVLAIEALAQSGDRDGASTRAKAFLKAFPTSPHASHVREFVR